MVTTCRKASANIALDRTMTKEQTDKLVILNKLADVFVGRQLTLHDAYELMTRPLDFLEKFSDISLSECNAELKRICMERLLW